MLNVDALNKKIQSLGMTVEQFYTKIGMTKRAWYYMTKSRKPGSAIIYQIHDGLGELTSQEENEIFWSET